MKNQAMLFLSLFLLGVAAGACDVPPDVVDETQQEFQKVTRPPGHHPILVGDQQCGDGSCACYGSKSEDCAAIYECVHSVRCSEGAGETTLSLYVDYWQENCVDCPPISTP